MNGYRLLWLSVLRTAILDSSGSEDASGPCSGTEMVQVSRDGIGSFPWVCHSLELDPAKLLRKGKRGYVRQNHGVR